MYETGIYVLCHFGIHFYPKNVHGQIPAEHEFTKILPRFFLFPPAISVFVIDVIILSFFGDVG